MVTPNAQPARTGAASATDAPASASPRGEADLTLDYLLRRMRFKSDFPALSASVSRVQVLSESEDDSLQALCDEILQDVALTNKLLKVVNTAHYRRAGTDPISTVSRAVLLLGVGGVRNLALSLMLLEHMPDRDHARQLKVEFLQTVMAGTVARELSGSTREAEEAFLGTLFRQLGWLLVSYYLPEDAEQIRERCQATDGQTPAPKALAQAARELLGVSLDDLGDHVAGLWGLPDTLRACMRTPAGEVPSTSLAARPERLWWLASLSHQAAHTLMHTEPAEMGEALNQLTQPYVKALGVSPSSLRDALGRSSQRLRDLTAALNMQLPGGPQVERLLETFYVDAPNAGQDPGPAPEVLGLDSEPGALVQDMPLPSQDAASVLTSGIQDIANTLVESFKLNDVLQMVMEIMWRALDCRRVVFCLRDPRSGALQGRLALGEGGDAVKALFKVSLVLAPGQPADLFTAVALRQADTLIADAAAPNIVNRLPLWFRDQVQAPTFLLLPLVVKRAGQADVVIGMLYADKGQAHSLQLNEQELSLLHTLRNQAVMAFKQTVGK